MGGCHLGKEERGPISRAQGGTPPTPGRRRCAATGLGQHTSGVPNLPSASSRTSDPSSGSPVPQVGADGSGFPVWRKLIIHNTATDPSAPREKNVFTPGKSHNSEIFHMLSALPSTDTGPLPFAEGPCGCAGEMAVGKGVLSLPACTRFMIWIVSCENRARTVAVRETYSIGGGNQKTCLYKRTLGMTSLVEPGGKSGSHQTLSLFATHHIPYSEGSALF